MLSLLLSVVACSSGSGLACLLRKPLIRRHVSKIHHFPATGRQHPARIKLLLQSTNAALHIPIYIKTHSRRAWPKLPECVVRLRHCLIWGNSRLRNFMNIIKNALNANYAKLKLTLSNFLIVAHGHRYQLHIHLPHSVRESGGVQWRRGAQGSGIGSKEKDRKNTLSVCVLGGSHTKFNLWPWYLLGVIFHFLWWWLSWLP